MQLLLLCCVALHVMFATAWRQRCLKVKQENTQLTSRVLTSSAVMSAGRSARSTSSPGRRQPLVVRDKAVQGEVVLIAVQLDVFGTAAPAPSLVAVVAPATAATH